MLHDVDDGVPDAARDAVPGDEAEGGQVPQFLDPSRGHLALQSLTLGLTQIVVAVSVNAMIVVSAGSVAAFLAARPRWMSVQRYATGAVLAGIAVTVALDRPQALPGR